MAPRNRSLYLTIFLYYRQLEPTVAPGSTFL